MASIRKFRSRWQAQVRRVGYPSQTRSFERRQDAVAWARALETELDQGRAAIPGRSQATLTLGDVIERYRVSVTPRKKGAFQENHRLERLAVTPLAKHRLTNLQASQVARFRDDRMRDVSSGTAARELSILRHVVEVARREWGVVMASNPFAEIVMPKPASARTRRLRDGEEGRLVDACKGSRNPLIKPIIQLAIQTGLRRGEILAIKPHHVDRAKRTLLIPDSKNGRARTVPLSQQALDVLLERLADGGDRLFPMTANAFRLAWERVKRRAGVDDLRFHDLRHEAVSRLFELGLSMPEVALISGHRTPAMLMRYSHADAGRIALKL